MDGKKAKIAPQRSDEITIKTEAQQQIELGENQKSSDTSCGLINEIKMTHNVIIKKEPLLIEDEPLKIARDHNDHQIENNMLQMNKQLQEDGFETQDTFVKQEPQVLEPFALHIQDSLQQEPDDMQDAAEFGNEEDEFYDSESSQAAEESEESQTSVKKKKRKKLPQAINPNKFKCNFCGASLDSKTSLIQHLMVQHAIQESYQCKDCGLSFGKITAYNHHLSRHDRERRFQCDFCTMRFAKKYSKDNHEATMHGTGNGKTSEPKPAKEKFKCSSCEKAYCNKSELKRHELRKHRGVSYITCQICGKPLASLRNLEDHLLIHQNPEEAAKLKLPKEKPLASRDGGENRQMTKCNICQTIFKQSKDIIPHFKETHPEASIKFYPCKDCGEVFFKLRALASHRYIHSDSYACDQCGKRHYSARCLAKHRHAVHGVPLSEELYAKCPVCDRKIVRGNNFKTHLRTHQNEKPFSCDQCDKCFRERRLLVVHQRVHSGEKPLACPGCGERFAAPSSLYKHKKRCTKLQSKPETTKALSSKRGGSAPPSKKQPEATKALNKKRVGSAPPSKKKPAATKALNNKRGGTAPPSKKKSAKASA